MKIIAVLLFIFFVSAAYVRSVHVLSLSKEARQQVFESKKKYILSCSPDLANFDFEDSANAIPLLEGWGNYNMPVTASNDSSRIYFEQGINMYYSFHIIEALASFTKAVTFDSGFAMGYWGKALAYGPNINDFGYSASPDALTAMQKAKELSIHCSAVEKGLIDAMQVRYSPDTTQQREKLNRLYAAAMQKVTASFPNSADAATLYADALMVQHPWDLYNHDYTAKKWTPEIVSVLEHTLQLNPKHPGANHYYIHAVEASSHPERALKSADFLSASMPDVSHMTHMPSHIYIRTGYYDKGIRVNDRAIEGFNKYSSLFPAVSENLPLYSLHNTYLKVSCAQMAGNYSIAMAASKKLRQEIPAMYLSFPGAVGNIMTYVSEAPLLTQIRFGKWDDILMQAKNDTLKNIRVIQHFGRGIAYAKTKQYIKAAEELTQLKSSMQEPSLKEPLVPFNAALDVYVVAENILAGTIAEEQNDYKNAISYFTKAVMAEDTLIYNEPRDWLIPARQYLGNAFLKAQGFTEATRVFKEDLEINPNNGWSLTGLAMALRKQNKKKEAAVVQQHAQKAFSGSETLIQASVF